MSENTKKAARIKELHEQLSKLNENLKSARNRYRKASNAEIAFILNKCKNKTRRNRLIKSNKGNAETNALINARVTANANQKRLESEYNAVRKKLDKESCVIV